MARRKRIKFNGKIYSFDSGHFHKVSANKKERQLRFEGWNVRVLERKSDYSGLEIFDVYKRRK